MEIYQADPHEPSEHHTRGFCASIEQGFDRCLKPSRDQFVMLLEVFVNSVELACFGTLGDVGSNPDQFGTVMTVEQRGMEVIDEWLDLGRRAKGQASRPTRTGKQSFGSIILTSFL